MHFLSTPRYVQGASIVLGSLFIAILVLAAAVAWGPHQCALVFAKIFGCAVGHYEGLTGGMLAAGTALFAGWLAWSAVQVQIAAEERRAAAERVEVEKVLQADLNNFAEGLSSIWRILLAIDAPPSIPLQDAHDLLEGVVYGIETIANTDWLNTSRQMVEKLGWERRRYYNELFQGIERLGHFRDIDNFDVEAALGRSDDLRFGGFPIGGKSDSTLIFGDRRWTVTLFGTISGNGSRALCPAEPRASAGLARITVGSWMHCCGWRAPAAAGAICPNGSATIIR